MSSVNIHASAYLFASTLSSLPAKSTGRSVTEVSVVGDLSTTMKQTNHDSDRNKKDCHACRGRHVVNKKNVLYPFIMMKWPRQNEKGEKRREKKSVVFFGTSMRKQFYLL
jgi:hypothetical protein